MEKNIIFMEDIIKKLTEIYPQNKIVEISNAIQQLIGAYQKVIPKQHYTLSQKDIILIAYGDHVQKQGEAPLSTFQSFSNKYIKGIINSIHILPFYPFSSDDGFSVIDYYAVNPELGNWPDVEKLGVGFRLMFDAVVNHISSESNWFKGFLKRDAKYQSYFVEMPPETDLSEVVRPRALPLLSDFVDSDAQTRYVWTTFSRDQIDLNYENPDVLLQVLDILLFYISKGAKLIRLDAIGFLWKVPGTTSIHLPETHAIIQLVRLVIEKLTQEVVLVTETNVPHIENISYFGDGTNEAQMVYNFTLPPLLAYSVLKENTVELQQWASNLALPSKKVCFFNFTASHDGIGVRPLQGILPASEIQFLAENAKKNGGFISYKNNPDGTKSPYELNCNYMDLLSHPEIDEEVRIDKMLLTQGVALAMPGIPGIYFHSIVGSGNYKEGVKETGMNRTINREKLGYKELQASLDNPQSFKGKYFRRYKHLIETRIKHDAFAPFSEFSFPNMNNKVFAIERTSSQEKVICLFNFSSEESLISLKEGEAVDWLTNKIENGVSISLKPWEQKWLWFKV